MSRWRSRKFWLVVGVELASIALLALDKLDSGGYVTITIAIIGTYVAGNVYQHKTEVTNA